MAQWHLQNKHCIVQDRDWELHKLKLNSYPSSVHDRLAMRFFVSHAFDFLVAPLKLLAESTAFVVSML